MFVSKLQRSTLLAVAAMALSLGVGCTQDGKLDEPEPERAGSLSPELGFNEPCLEPPPLPQLPDGSFPPEPVFQPPEEGLVPDEATAVKVAEAVLLPIYAEDTLARERPFLGCLKGDVWTVSGTVPAGADGGAAEVKISRADGRILRIVHYE